MKSLEIDLEVILIVVIVCAVLYMYKSGQLCNLIKPTYNTFAVGAPGLTTAGLCQHIRAINRQCDSEFGGAEGIQPGMPRDPLVRMVMDHQQPNLKPSRRERLQKTLSIGNAKEKIKRKSSQSKLLQ